MSIDKIARAVFEGAGVNEAILVSALLHFVKNNLEDLPESIREDFKLEFGRANYDSLKDLE